MAVDSRISLGSVTPDFNKTFSNALLNIQRGQGIEQQKIQAPFQNRMLEAQTIGAEQGNVAAAQTNDIRSLAVFGAELGPAIQAGDLFSITSLTQQRIQQIDQRGGNSKHSRELLAKLQDPNLSDQQKVDFTRNAAQQMNKLAVQTGAIKAGASGGLASAKTEILDDGTIIQALPDGSSQVLNPAGTPVTGQARTDALNKSKDFRIAQKREEAEVVQTVSRTSAIKKEFSQRRRDSAREAIRINQALKVAASATQGTAGAAKLKLAKLFPSIDVTNEALLDQTLQQLTIDQLQKFKGPTTDFEFGKAQATVGAVGDSKTANVARLNSLERARWFNQRESGQFDRHIKAGGDPDAFSFNFGETIKTRRGVLTLQDLQETAVANNLTIQETIAELNKAKK